MGVRIIGDKGNFGVMVQRPKGIVSVGVGDSETIELRPVASEYKFDGADNGNESKPDGETSSVDPASISTGSNGSGDAPYGYTKTGRRRNRPIGGTSRGNASTGDTSKAANSLATLICMLHGVVSNIVKIPALKISLEDSRELTAAGMQVAELYDVPLPTEKVAAWMNLGAVAYKVYIVSDKKKPVIFNREVEETQAAVPNFMM